MRKSEGTVGKKRGHVGKNIGLEADCRLGMPISHSLQGCPPRCSFFSAKWSRARRRRSKAWDGN